MEEKEGFGCGLYGGAACWLADTTPLQSIVYEYFTHPCPLTPNRLSGIVTFFTKPRLCPLRGSTGLKKSVPEMVAKSGRSALSGCIHVLG